MKKIFLLITICGLSQILFSQSIEFRSGITSSTLRTDYGIMGNHIIKPTASIGIHYVERKYFNLYSSIGYLSKGSRFPYPESGYGPQLNYISVSSGVQLKYPLGKLTPYLLAGPTLDYNTSSNDFIPKIKRYSYGALLGAGVNINVSPKVYIGIGAKYLPSFKSLSKAYNVNDHTFVFDIGIGIKLR